VSHWWIGYRTHHCCWRYCWTIRWRYYWTIRWRYYWTIRWRYCWTIRWRYCWTIRWRYCWTIRWRYYWQKNCCLMNCSMSYCWAAAGCYWGEAGYWASQAVAVGGGYSRWGNR